MAGRKHKVKGSRVEREIVQLHKDAGHEAERMPLSGAAGGSFSGDLLLKLPVVGRLIAEVKARKAAQGFKSLIKWLGDCDLLFLRRDQQVEPYVFMRWELYKRLISRD